MTDPSLPKFIQKKFFLKIGGEAIELTGLLSHKGIAGIFSKDARVMGILSQMAGKPFDIQIDSFNLTALIERQFSGAGSVIDLRFINVSPMVSEKLKEKVEQEGSVPNWQRLHPRIPIAGAANLETTLPSLCVIRHAKLDHYLNVLNFTLGGLRMETMTDVLSEIQVGDRIVFDLVTTSGDVLSSLRGEVRNIGLHRIQDKKTEEIRRSFGVKLDKMESPNEKIYNEMIKKLCVKVKKLY